MCPARLRRLLLLILALLAPLAFAQTRPDYPAALTDLYEHIGKTYPEFEMKHIDWPAVGKELLPRAASVKNDAQFGLLVEELVSRLKDSHAVVQPGTCAVPEPDLPDWDPGFACLEDDGQRPVVYVIEPNSPAAKAGIRLGDTVLNVDGIAAEDAIKQTMGRLQTYFGYSSERTLRYDAMRSFVAQNDQGHAVHLTIRHADGEEFGVSAAATCQSRYLPRLPVPRQGIGDSVDCSSILFPNGVGYIYVRRISNDLNRNLDAALETLGSIRGLVIDVRGNSGGGFDADSSFANFDPKEKRWPQRPRFTGPIAMLTDERTISAGEGWASWFYANHRARFFGSTTAGASSRKEVYTLSDGLFKVVIPVKAYTGFLNRPIECVGLPPDVPVRCSAKDIVTGQDTVVNAAIAWLLAQPRSATTHGS